VSREVEAVLLLLLGILSGLGAGYLFRSLAPKPLYCSDNCRVFDGRTFCEVT
jgi:hypothetical protein